MATVARVASGRGVGLLVALGVRVDISGAAMGVAVSIVSIGAWTRASTVASRLGVGSEGSPAHAAVVATTTAASKAITLLNWVAIAGYYSQAVTI